MANEDSVLKEVDQELAEERQWLMFRKYGPALIGASAALVIGVGAWQFFDASRTSAANKEAVQFAEAAELLSANPTEGRDALQAIADDGGSGYAALAQFRRAASLAAADERDAAIAVFAAIYNDGATPQPMRDLARLRAAYLSLQDGRDIVLGHLGPLTESDGAYGPYADEVAGLAALKAEDYETALSLFSTLASLPQTPPSLAQRAEEYLALAVAGKAGVNLAGRFELDQVIGAVGAADANAPVTADESDGQASAESTTEEPAESDAGDNNDASENEADEPSESGNE